MKTFLKRFETLMMAVTFAEAGEFGTAKQILEKENDKIRNKRDYGKKGIDGRIASA